MANNAANVRVAISGAFMVADLGTALPTTAADTPNMAFKDAGYISEDGITQTIDSDTTDIKAWQNGDVVRTIQTSHKVTLQLTMLETTALTNKIYYADSEASATAVKVAGKQAPHQTVILDVLDGDKVIRLCAPDAQVTERGEITYKNEEAISYNVTLTCYPDSKGVKLYKYLK
jgi:hypothetical protein